MQLLGTLTNESKILMNLKSPLGHLLQSSVGQTVDKINPTPTELSTWLMATAILADRRTSALHAWLLVLAAHADRRNKLARGRQSSVSSADNFIVLKRNIKRIQL